MMLSRIFSGVIVASVQFTSIVYAENNSSVSCPYEVTGPENQEDGAFKNFYICEQTTTGSDTVDVVFVDVVDPRLVLAEFHDVNGYLAASHHANYYHNGYAYHQLADIVRFNGIRTNCRAKGTVLILGRKYRYQEVVNYPAECVPN